MALVVTALISHGPERPANLGADMVNVHYLLRVCIDETVPILITQLSASRTACLGMNWRKFTFQRKKHKRKRILGIKPGNWSAI